MPTYETPITNKTPITAITKYGRTGFFMFLPPYVIVIIFSITNYILLEIQKNLKRNVITCHYQNNFVIKMPHIFVIIRHALHYVNQLYKGISGIYDDVSFSVHFILQMVMDEKPSF